VESTNRELPESRAAPDESAAALPRPRALIASRDAATRRWGIRWLARSGFDVVEARDGDKALSCFGITRPDVVMVDWSLKDSRGHGVCSVLRDEPGAEELPILAFCEETKEALEALDEGSTDVIVRPFDWRILARRIELLVGSHRARQALGRAQTMLESARSSAEVSRQQLEQLAKCDPLTGLSNRAAFEERLENTVAVSGDAAVLVIGLDRFQLINRAYGRNVGDEVLRQVARRLSDSVRGRYLVARSRPGPATSSLARLSGDEFTMMISNVSRSDQVTQIAQRLHMSLANAFVIEDLEIFLSASIGAAIAPVDGKDAELVVQHAESAMKEAKRSGSGLVRFYSLALDADTKRSFKIGRLLRRAIENEELAVHYQPLVDLGTQRVVGAEALLRWEDPELGSVSPAEFVPLAEESDLMVTMGKWVLTAACRQLKEWIDEGLPRIRMAVNVSQRQLVGGNFAETVRDVLEESGVEGFRLELELSERGALSSDPTVLRQLSELKEMGVRLSVDDFGTGNSAIGYLKRFPLDALKIDRSYISAVSGSENDAAIASATIAMAHKLRLEVVAEGVEQRDQLEFLRGCGCDQYQGYLFSHAVPSREFRHLLLDA